jgi:hypothetical protein
LILLLKRILKDSDIKISLAPSVVKYYLADGMLNGLQYLFLTQLMKYIRKQSIIRA